jgi:4-amino-4-deoxy-L-arabinose transferase-like glycosyltransferase
MSSEHAPVREPRGPLTIIEDRFSWSVGTVLAVGVLFRLVLIVTTTSPGDPLNRLYPGYTDGAEYLDNARSLVETGVYGYGGRPSAFRPPAYPFLVALSLKVFGETLTAVRLLHVVLFLATTICYTVVTTKLFGKLTGMLTALGFSLYPLFAFITTEIATENLYMPLASLVFALTFPLLRAGRRPVVRALWGAAVGAGCGLGILTRSNMLFVMIALQAVIVWNALKRGERFIDSAVSIAGLWIGALVVLSPWLIRNEIQMGAPVVGTNLQYNLFRGTFDLVGGINDGRSIDAIFKEHGVMYEEEIEDAGRRTLSWDEVSNERNAGTAALWIIRSDPARWLKERLKNFVFLWLNLQWESMVMHGALVHVASVFVTMVYYAVLATAVLASIAPWRGWNDPDKRIFAVLALIFIVAATSVVITFVGKRYRVSMIDPYLILLACTGIGLWLDRRGREADGQRC